MGPQRRPPMLRDTDDDGGAWLPIAAVSGGLAETLTLQLPDQPSRLRVRVHETENPPTPRPATDALSELGQRTVFLMCVDVRAGSAAAAIPALVLRSFSS